VEPVPADPLSEPHVGDPDRDDAVVPTTIITPFELFPPPPPSGPPWTLLRPRKSLSESQDEINQGEWESSWNWDSFGRYSSAIDTRLWVPHHPKYGPYRHRSVGNMYARGLMVNFGHPDAGTYTLNGRILLGLLLGALLLGVGIYYFAR